MPSDGEPVLGAGLNCSESRCCGALAYSGRAQTRSCGHVGSNVRFARSGRRADISRLSESAIPVIAAIRKTGFMECWRLSPPKSALTPANFTTFPLLKAGVIERVGWGRYQISRRAAA
jgi:hypothetical protein